MTEKISHKIIRNTAFNILGRFWNIIIALFLTPYIIGHIGVERYGVWSLVSLLTGYFGLLDLGIGYSFVKYISEFYAKKDYRRINEIVNTGFVFYFLFAAVIVVLVFLNMNLLLTILKIPAYLHREVTFVFLLGILIFGFFNVFSSFFAIQSGLQRRDVSNKIAMVCSVPMVIGTVFFLQKGYGLPGLMVNNGLVFLISSMVNFIAVFRILPELRFNPALSSWRVFKTLFSFGFKVQVSRVAQICHSQLDKFLLAYFLNISLVTFYSVASNMASKLMELPIVMITVIQPAASELDAKSDKQRLTELYFRSMKYVVLLVLPISLLAVFLAGPFINLWLGRGYEISVVTLQVLVIAYFLNILTGPGYCILNGIGKPQYAMRSSLFAIAANLCLSIILVIKIGYFGVVLGTATAISLAAFYFLFMFYRVTNISFGSSVKAIFLKPLTAGFFSLLVSMKLIELFPRVGWAVLIIVCVVYLASFLTVILLSGCIDGYDKLLINRYTKLRIFKSAGT